MIKKTDMMELRRRLTKENCTFTRMSGCYVTINQEKLTKINEIFLNLDDEEFFKYLEIAKKAISGKVGENLLQSRVEDADARRLLGAVKESGLKGEELLDGLYDRIIEMYDAPGNYLILLFHDVYDVMVKTSDRKSLDESEEAYEYILCAICPVKLSEPGLSYLEDRGVIGCRIRDWVVSAPEMGFLYPAFDNRSADMDTAVIYTKNTKKIHSELFQILGCGNVAPASVKRDKLHTAVKQYATDDDAYYDIQSAIKKEAELNGGENMADRSILEKIMADAGIKHDLAERMIHDFSGNLGEAQTNAAVKELVDEKFIAAYEQGKARQLQMLIAENNVTVLCKDESCIRRENIDGQAYLLIPAEGMKTEIRQI